MSQRSEQNQKLLGDFYCLYGWCYGQFLKPKWRRRAFIKGRAYMWNDVVWGLIWSMSLFISMVNNLSSARARAFWAWWNLVWSIAFTRKFANTNKRLSGSDSNVIRLGGENREKSRRRSKWSAGNYCVHASTLRYGWHLCILRCRTSIWDGSYSDGYEQFIMFLSAWWQFFCLIVVTVIWLHI